MEISLYPNDLSSDEYKKIKESANWGGVPEKEFITMALTRSLYTVVARDGRDAVGMARLIGDGIFYWHVQDVIVLPEYQGMGIGKLIMEHLINYIEKNIPDGSTKVGLMSAIGKEGFYEKFGFKKRSDNNHGEGMERKIQKSL
ncbi:MAG: GNAT family N-acetyltransferase [Clostridiales bacterium]|nr:GNAT family N-acetyltransferase [Clostridiales bacterium]